MIYNNKDLTEKSIVGFFEKNIFVKILKNEE
jgi:hypothetical protein